MANKVLFVLFNITLSLFAAAEDTAILPRTTTPDTTMLDRLLNIATIQGLAITKLYFNDQR